MVGNRDVTHTVVMEHLLTITGIGDLVSWPFALAGAAAAAAMLTGFAGNVILWFEELAFHATSRRSAGKGRP